MLFAPPSHPALSLGSAGHIKNCMVSVSYTHLDVYKRQPFMERGFDICGIDLSGEMLDRLRQKAPHAAVTQADIFEYIPKEPYDYILSLIHI